MSNLRELLMALGRNAELATAYERDPEQVLREYGLNEEETSAMLAKDLEKVKRLSGLDNLKCNGNIHCHEP